MPNHRITKPALRAERERYRKKPQQSPRRHATTVRVDRERVKYWKDMVPQGLREFNYSIGNRFYTVTAAGYLIKDPATVYWYRAGPRMSSTWAHTGSDAN